MERGRIKELLVEQNPQWEGRWKTLEKERDVVKELVKEGGRRRVTLLYGPRRVGKTTALWQALRKLAEGRERRSLYFSFDRFPLSPIEVVRAFRELMGHNLREGPYWIVLDEIQKVPQWGEEVKYLYDTFGESVKIYVSGSASLHVRKGRESLAGRVKEIRLSALTYGEYLRLTGKVDGGDRAFIAFLGRQLPALALEDWDVKEYSAEIVEKVIEEDMAQLYGLKEHTQEVAKSLFRIIAKEPGIILKASELAGELEVSRQTIARLLAMMERSFLIRRLYNRAGSARKSEARGKRYYPYFPTLSYYTFPFLPEEGKMAESYAADVLSATYFWRKGKREVDLVRGDMALGVEVKWRRNVRKRNLAGLVSAPLQERWIATREDTSIELPPGVKIGRIELRWIERLRSRWGRG